MGRFVSDLIHRHPEGWQAEQARIKAEANAKRAENWANQHTNRVEEKRVVEQIVPPPSKAPDKHKERQSKAAASKTNAGAGARTVVQQPVEQLSVPPCARGREDHR